MMRCSKSLGAILAITTVLVTSAVYAQTLKSVSTFVVVDANNRVIGRADLGDVARGSDLNLLFQVGEQVFALEVQAAGWRRGEASSLLFESTDCSGQPFISATMEILTPAFVSPPGNTVYLPIPGSAMQTINPRSERDRDGQCSPVSFFEPSAFPAQAVINLDTLFTPPFRVQIEAGSKCRWRCRSR